jgi:uncharacterized protein YyaL (SSP411 family)
MRHLIAQATAPGLVFICSDEAVADEVSTRSSAQDFALLESRTRIDGKDTAYVCQQFSCAAPTTDLEVLSANIGATVHRQSLDEGR